MKPDILWTVLLGIPALFLALPTLADLFAGTFGGDETEREVGFVGGFIPGRGLANEHDGEVGLTARVVKRLLTILWHYKDFPEFIGGFPGVFGSSLRWVREKC